MNNPCVKYEKAVERIRALDVNLKMNRNIMLVERYKKEPQIPDKTYSLFLKRPRQAN